ncbi:MAG: hypothetical protein ACSLE1_15655 [Sphingobium sp.]
MRHKGYEAQMAYSEEDAGFVGLLTIGKDMVGFFGKSEAEAERDFRDGIDDYLADLKQGRSRNK